MRKKIFVFMAIIAMVLMCLGVSYAADKADTAQYVTSVVGLADTSSGNCVEVDSNGAIPVTVSAGTAEVGKVKISDGTDTALVDGDKNLMVEEDGDSVKYLTPTANTIVLNGAGVLKAVVFSSPTAGDSLYLYDQITSSKSLTIYGVTIGTNNDSISSGPLNIDVGTGIFAIKSNTASRVTIVYDDSQT
jgi:hypothetical protein